MNKVLHKIIDRSQLTFITRKGMLDSVLVVNETMEDIKRKKAKRGSN